MLAKLLRTLFNQVVSFILFLLFLIRSPLVFAAGPDELGDCVTPEGVPTLKCLEVIFGNVLSLASGLIVLALFIMFVVGSLRYLTSGGNPENIKKAQGTLKWALVGTLLFVGSFLILKIINFLFLGEKVNLFKFEIPEF